MHICLQGQPHHLHTPTVSIKSASALTDVKHVTVSYILRYVTYQCIVIRFIVSVSNFLMERIFNMMDFYTSIQKGGAWLYQCTFKLSSDGLLLSVSEFLISLQHKYEPNGRFPRAVSSYFHEKEFIPTPNRSTSYIRNGFGAILSTSLLSKVLC